MATPILVIQIATFVVLGAYFMAHGQLRLGIAQMLLAVVQGVIYSVGRLSLELVISFNDDGSVNVVPYDPAIHGSETLTYVWMPVAR